MRLGRGGAGKSKPPTLPERAQTVTLVPGGGGGLPARVLELGTDTLLVAVMVPVAGLAVPLAMANWNVVEFTIVVIVNVPS